MGRYPFASRVRFDSLGWRDHTVLNLVAELVIQVGLLLSSCTSVL